MATSTSKEVIETRDIYIGTPGAPVKLICYMDYESPECAKLNDALNELFQMYPGKFQVNVRHFPMANKHQKAMKAAEAVVAAAQEGLFWQMNNMVFKNQKKLGTISLKQYAKEIGSTNKRFLDQVINGIYAWQVREDLLEALNKGIRNVPAVYINDKLFEEEISFETLSRVIKENLDIA